MFTKLSQELHNLFLASGKTLGTAESCTGGAIAASIVATSGASAYFKGGIISYCNEVKESLLGVSHDTLKARSAVCEDVAIEMAQGAIKALDVDYAVSATGIAGPQGGTDSIPVGTIWLCCCNKSSHMTLKLEENNGRKSNLDNAVMQALRMLIQFIKDRQ